MTREVRANGSDTTYTYEPLGGQLQTVTDPEDQVKTYAYALDDALSSITYTNANVATPTVSYTYSTQYPRLATMVDGLGTTTCTYHPGGQTGGGQVASIDGPRTNDTLTYACFGNTLGTRVRRGPGSGSTRSRPVAPGAAQPRGEMVSQNPHEATSYRLPATTERPDLHGSPFAIAAVVGTEEAGVEKCR